MQLGGLLTVDSVVIITTIHVHLSSSFLCLPIVIIQFLSYLTLSTHLWLLPFSILRECDTNFKSLSEVLPPTPFWIAHWPSYLIAPLPPSADSLIPSANRSPLYNLFVATFPYFHTYICIVLIAETVCRCLPQQTSRSSSDCRAVIDFLPNKQGELPWAQKNKCVYPILQDWEA